MNLFIASSTEPRAEAFAQRVAALLEARFDVETWRRTDPAASLEALRAAAGRAEAGLFFLAAGAASETGRSDPSGPDVLWAAAVFAGVLGAGRVVLVAEDGVALPAAAAGLPVVRYGSNPDASEPPVQACLDQLEARLEAAGQHGTAPAAVAAGDAFGFRQTLTEAHADIGATAALLNTFARTQSPESAAPLYFDSLRLCVATYAEALDRVAHRFWTTTLLSSGFWIDNHPRVLEANARLMRRLRQNGQNARRLFLLQLPPDREVERWQDERIRLGKFGDTEGLQRLDAQFKQLYASIMGILESGCEVRAAYDARQRYRSLPAALAFDYQDAEVAIYDDWRVDLFRGGRSKTIRGVQCFTPLCRDFEAVRDAAVAYFEERWREAEPIDRLLNRIRQAFEAASERIDYQPNWLARYDHGLPAEDENLKRLELGQVQQVLKQSGRWGHVRRYLDVGTCTGRYVINLRQAVQPGGALTGIDNDPDAVRFARWNVRQECGEDDRITIERMDFCAPDCQLEGSFDLITCMLGTLLHFGRNRQEALPYHDALQRAIERFAALLSEDGSLFFSVWSDAACRDLDLLSIYSQDDMERLAEWNPSRRELQERLRLGGLRFGQPYSLAGRLDLYHCRRAPVPVGV